MCRNIFLIFIALITAGNLSLQAESASEVLTVSDLQLPFVANQGQYDPRIKYTVRTIAGEVLVAEDNLTYVIAKYDQNNESSNEQSAAVAVIRENFVDSQNYNILAKNTAPAKISYFSGTDEDWSTNVSAFYDLEIESLWPGINLTLGAGYGNIEKVFTVLPTANPLQIKMQLQGAESLQISEDGELLVTTAVGQIEFSKPRAWQNGDHGLSEVQIAYTLLSNNEYGFDIGAYNVEQALYIDPLIAGTYLGAGGTDTLYGVAADSSGNIFAIGSASANITGAPYPAPSYGTYSASTDTVIFKINSSLDTLSAMAFLGGAGADVGRELVISAAGDIYALSECAAGFPVTGGVYDGTHNGSSDLCLSRLNNNLTSLTASTFLGGTAAELAGGIAYDESNSRVVVLGSSSSANYPVACTACTAFQAVASTAPDFTLSVLNNSLTGLISSTYYGGTGSENFTASTSDTYNRLLLDASGNIIFTGQTTSATLASAGAYDTTVSSTDAIIAKFDQTLSTTGRLVSTYLGGSLVDSGQALAFDSNANLYVTGITASVNFPVTFGVVDSGYHGGNDIFIAKFTPTLLAGSLQAANYLGSSGNDIPYAIAFDASENLVIVGSTDNASFPVSATACDATFATGREGFLLKINSSLNGGYKATYLGDSGNSDVVRDIVSYNNLFHIVGETNSAANISTAGAFDTVVSGVDGLVARIDPDFCVAPAVLSVSSSLANGTYPAATIVDITLTFSGPVNVIGTPQLTLESGAIDRVVNYVSGSGSEELLFNYTVQSGDQSADLDYISTAALNLNGGSISSPSGTAASITLPAPGASGSLSANKNIAIDANIPNAPVINTPLNNAYLITTTPFISGTAEANTLVEVKEGMTTLCSDTSDLSGNWSCQSSVLAQGLHAISVTATDAAINISSAANININVDTIVPTAPVVSSPLNLGYVNSAIPLISGTAEALSTINIYEAGLLLCSTTADALGDWDCASSALTDGLHFINVFSIDLAANQSLPNSLIITVDTVVPNAPLIISPVNAEEVNLATPTISGTAEAGSTVEVFEGLNPLCSVLTDVLGNWSCVSAALAEGSHIIQARVTDSANNLSLDSNLFFVVDSIAPLAPVVNSPANASSSNINTPLFTGTSEANANIEIKDGATTLCTTMANGLGNWSCYLAAQSDGVYNYNIFASDSAGNVSPVLLHALTIDTLAPAAPVINSPSNNSSNSDDTPLISGTAEANANINIYDGIVLIGSTVADGAGNWSITPVIGLSLGSHTINIIASDTAGNQSSAASINLTIYTLQGCSPYSLAANNQAINKHAVRLQKLVRKAGKNNRENSAAGICQSVPAAKKQLNKQSALTLKDEIATILTSEVVDTNLYACAGGVPAGCLTADYSLPADDIKSRVSGLENLVSASIGKCAYKTESALSIARKARKNVRRVHKAFNNLPTDLASCQ